MRCHAVAREACLTTASRCSHHGCLLHLYSCCLGGHIRQPSQPVQVWVRQHEVKEETVLFQELPHALRNEVAWQACRSVFG